MSKDETIVKRINGLRAANIVTAWKCFLVNEESTRPTSSIVDLLITPAEKREQMEEFYEIYEAIEDHFERSEESSGQN